MGRRQAESRPCGSRGGRRSSWQHSALLLSASVLSSCFLLSQAGMNYIPVVTDPPSPEEGGNVTFIPQGGMNDSISCAWHRGRFSRDNGIMIVYGPPYNVRNLLSEYTDRETVVWPLCALHIRDLTLNDSSTYYLSLEKPGLMQAGVVELEVRELPPGRRGAGGGLTKGVVVGIVVGFLAVVMVVAGVSYFRKRGVSR